MDELQKDLQSLFERDLNQLIENIEATAEEDLWKSPDGVTNSCGVLAQHIVGNLHHHIGTGLGNTGYVREREKEFMKTGASKEDLIADVEELKSTLAEVFEQLDSNSLDEKYPLEISYDMTTRKLLLHVYGHLHYHLGQYNYLRRILSKNG